MFQNMDTRDQRFTGALIIYFIYCREHSPLFARSYVDVPMFQTAKQAVRLALS
jgi:hypothetical protein